MARADVLAQKRKELDTYSKQFESAISMVTDTISSLSTINENIETKIDEIEQYQEELSKTKDGLSGVLSKNKKVIKNFNTLLCVEDECEEN